jgi:peptidoglycan biosynthesis protein MviN/MurJ (putative lipid II flippase)
MNRLRLLSSTLSVSSLRLVGQMIALASGLLVANFFGATTDTDDYYTALILPGALANLIINALTNLFAPIYLQHVHDEPEQGPKIISSLMTVALAALAVATAACLIAVPFYTGIREIDTEGAYTRALVFGLILAVNCPLVGLSRPPRCSSSRCC